MKYTILALAAALIAISFSGANAPKKADIQSVLDAEKMTVVADDGASVTITVHRKSGETWGELFARAWVAGAKWQRENPNKSGGACFAVVSKIETPDRQAAVWSTYYTP
jgi:DNA gyrase/topoisomerase IV subunit B